MKVFQKFAVSFIAFVLSDCSKEAVFRINKQKYLANHTIEIKQAEFEFECGLLCARHESCASINYKTSGEDKGRCELNNKTNEDDDDEKTNHEYNHLVMIKSKPLDPTTSSSPTQEQSFTIACLTCSNEDWRESFDSKGWSKCRAENLFITGFYRSPPNNSLLQSLSPPVGHNPPNNSDPISLLEEARCCTSSPAYSSQNGQCNVTIWRSSFNKNENWNLCPVGYFLNGLLRTEGVKLSAINNGHCCKPNNHPDQYGSCYDEDVGSSFNQEGWSSCSKAGYYITGLYRGSGDNWLNNIDKFRCCQNAEQYR